MEAFTWLIIGLILGGFLGYQFGFGSGIRNKINKQDGNYEKN